MQTNAARLQAGEVSTADRYGFLSAASIVFIAGLLTVFSARAQTLDSTNVRAVPTYESVGLYWSTPGASSAGCEVKYRAKILELDDYPGRRAAMGAFGRRRVENELEWRYEVPKLLAAYGSLWAPKPGLASEDRAAL